MRILTHAAKSPSLLLELVEVFREFLEVFFVQLSKTSGWLLSFIT
jgi:hypothetical protein